MATLAVGSRGGQAAASPSRRLEPRDEALPAFGFLAEDGSPRDLDAFAGSALVLNFWATWCAPCVEEMPALDRLAGELAPEGTQVLALSQDRGGAKAVRAFYDRTGVEALGIWLDPRGAAARAFGARGLPTTVLVSRSRRLVGWAEGALAWDSPDVIAELRRLLG